VLAGRALQWQRLLPYLGANGLGQQPLLEFCRSNPILALATAGRARMPRRTETEAARFTIRAGGEGGRAIWPGRSQAELAMTRDAPRALPVAFGPFRLFPARRLLLEGETPVRLGSRAWDLLIALLEQAGQEVGKEALSARIWPNAIVEDGTLRAQVAVLRKAL